VAARLAVSNRCEASIKYIEYDLFTVQFKADPPAACSTIKDKIEDRSGRRSLTRSHLDRYIADRFPISFTKFVKEQLERRSILPTDLYVHNRSIADVFEWHRRAGYSNFYFLETRRGQLHRKIYLAL
jgi:hypothetical protein